MASWGPAVIALAIAGPSPTHEQARYSLQDLGTLGGRSSTASDLNAKGQVVGESETAAGASHPFLFSKGKMLDLGTLGGRSGSAWGINAAGQVVGGADSLAGKEHAFLFTAGKMRDLTGVESRAYDINDFGVIVGEYRAPRGKWCLRAFRMEHGNVSWIGLPKSDLRYWTIASGINRFGQIVGSANFSFPSLHACFLGTDRLEDLGTLGGDQSQAFGINDHGDVVGCSMTSGITGLTGHAFFRSAGKMIDLGTLGGTNSSASDVNNTCTVVGWSDTKPAVYRDLAFHGGNCQAFVAKDGKMWNLNKLLDRSGKGWTVVWAAAINDAGQIAGTACSRKTGRLHAVLLTPQGKPPAMK